MVYCKKEVETAIKKLRKYYNEKRPRNEIIPKIEGLPNNALLYCKLCIGSMIGFDIFSSLPPIA